MLESLGFSNVSEITIPNHEYRICMDAEYNFTALLLAQFLKTISPKLLEISLATGAKMLVVCKPNPAVTFIGQGEQNYLVVAATNAAWLGQLVGVKDTVFNQQLAMRPFEPSRGNEVNTVNETQRRWGEGIQATLNDLKQKYPLSVALGLLTQLAQGLQSSGQYDKNYHWFTFIQ